MDDMLRPVSCSMRDPVPQRVDVHVQLLGGALPGAARVEERGRGAEQVRAVQGVVVDERGQQLPAEGAPQPRGHGRQQRPVRVDLRAGHDVHRSAGRGLGSGLPAAPGRLQRRAQGADAGGGLADPDQQPAVAQQRAPAVRGGANRADQLVGLRRAVHQQDTVRAFVDGAEQVPAGRGEQLLQQGQRCPARLPLADRRDDRRDDRDRRQPRIGAEHPEVRRDLAGSRGVGVEERDEPADRRPRGRRALGGELQLERQHTVQAAQRLGGGGVELVVPPGVHEVAVRAAGAVRDAPDRARCAVDHEGVPPGPPRQDGPPHRRHRGLVGRGCPPRRRAARSA
jgi:hypothetical protein